ncbi:MAG: hypothetical protein Kow0088_17050 [Anaerolineales bacterium]
MSIDIRAHANYIPHSPQKVRLLVDLVRGKRASEAQDILRFAPQAAATPLLKLINSAVANAEENFGLNQEDLYIHAIFADQAPTRKWRKFGARGRFKPWLRRSSHITVILREKE